MMTADDLRARLRLECKQETRTAVAARYGFTPPFILRAERGEVPVSERLAEAMGFRKVIMFERINGE